MQITAVSLASVGRSRSPLSFQPERVRHLQRVGGEMLIDRISGAWMMVGTQDADLIPLLASPLAALPSSPWMSRLGALHEQLKEQGIGYAQWRPPHDQLNTVILKLTNACNLACTYCYDHEDMERATVLPVADVERVLAQALDLVDQRLWVILHGGEPTLLWPHIEKIVLAGEALAVARGKQIEFTGQTNLTRLDERMVRFSVEHGIDWGVSLDGDAPVNDRFRILHNGNGSFSLFEKALTRFPRFVRSCGVMTTVTAINAHRLYPIAQFFRDQGMAAWDWSLFQPIGRARHATDMEPDAEEVLRSWSELFDAVERGEFDGFPVKPVTKYLDNFIQGPGGNMCMRGDCGAARDLLSISANGVIEACDCIDPQGPLAGLGNVATDSLEAARASETAKSIRSRDMNGHTMCSECLWYGVCGGTCLAHAQGLGDVWPLGCAVAQLAFDRISDSLSRGDRLLTYRRSLS